MPEPTIRPCRTEDLDRCAEIAVAAWSGIHEIMRGLMGEAMHRDLCANWEAGKADQLRRHLEAHPDWFLVVADGDLVLGFVTFFMDPERSIGEIGNNAVSSEARGRGIGPLMYNHVLDRFRASGLKYAEVSTGLDEGHAPARRAYEKVGFDVQVPKVTYYRAL